MRSNIDEILSINPSANVFVFGDFNIHNKDWVTYSGEKLIHLVNSVIIFLSQMTLLRRLTFLLGSQAVILIIFYLPLIWKNFVTHMHGLAVYVKEGLPFALDLSLEKFAFSYLCFQLALIHLVSYLFVLYLSPSLSWCMVFDVSAKINEVLSINPAANVFFFVDFSVHHKDLLTFSGGTNRSGKLYLKWPYSDG